MEERLQKILARAGIGSRRACEDLITQGRVSVNGQTAMLGSKADPQTDRILVDGHPLETPEELVYVALHKPRGVISTVDAPDPRPTVRELVDLPQRLYPVGRLDVESEGLIIMTNDGELANRLTHPRYGHEKEYKVLVARRPDEEQLNAWRRGIVLEDGYQTQPAEVRVEALAGKGTWLRIILHEGRKRQIRETGSQLGLPVVRIVRIRIGPVLLGGLKVREWRYLTPQELDELKGKKKAAATGRSAGVRPAGRSASNYKSSNRSGVGQDEPGRKYKGQPLANKKKSSGSGTAGRGAGRASTYRSETGRDELPDRSGPRSSTSRAGGAPGRANRRSEQGDEQGPRDPSSRPARRPVERSGRPISGSSENRPAGSTGSRPPRRSPGGPTGRRGSGGSGKGSGRGAAPGSNRPPARPKRKER